MYTFSVHPRGTFDEVVARTRDELMEEGFGVLTEIDMAATMKAKLGVEMEPYLILGACNPSLAHRAVTVEPSIGALLPCNVVVRQSGGTVTVDFMDPSAALGLVAKPEVHDVGAEARERLERVSKALSG